VLAQICVENDVVMLTYDAFNRRLEDPKMYMLFYDYFLCAIVGQETFERNIHKVSEDKEGFGTPTDHGFVHLILKNNQDEWEEKIKAKQGSFLTMHDDESKVKNKKTIVDHLFPSLGFDENMNLIKGERDLAQAERVRKGKERKKMCESMRESIKNCESCQRRFG
jgi:hypothetical protein